MPIAIEELCRGLPGLAVEFFCIFSRFECAMKRIERYLGSGGNSVRAEWDKMAADLGEEFFEKVRSENIAPDLISKPPKKQIKQEDSSLGWKDAETVKDVRGLFQAIRDARNNLFHGGKYMDVESGGPISIQGSERNYKLLRQSIDVLRLVLRENEEIYSEFRGEPS